MTTANHLPHAHSENMRPPEAAEYLGLSLATLARYRMAVKRKDGPPFVKVAGCVIYRRADLDAWLARNVVEAA